MKINNLYILVLVFFLSFSTAILAQKAKIDSLKIELQNHIEKDTTKVKLLNNLAFFSFQSDLEATKLYLKKAEDLSNDLNYIKGKAKVLYLRGILESRKSNYKGSLYFFKGSLKYYESINYQDGIASIYNAFGIIYTRQGQYEEALAYYKKTAKINKSIGNKSVLIKNLLNIGNVYSETGRYNEAISNYKNALNHSIEINDEVSISSIQYNLSILYKVQGNYPLAIEYTNKGLEFKQKIGDTLGIANVLNNLGDIYGSLNKYDTALEYHKQSLDFSLQKGNVALIAVNNNNIGNVYLHKKEYTKALEYYRKSLEVSQEINSIKQVSSSFINIGKINLLLNKPLVARENFIKAIDISEKANIRDHITYSFLGISETYIHEKKYRKALSFVQKGRELSEELELLTAQQKASELLSEIYKNTGNYKRAFESHQQFKILSDSLFNKENIEKITRLEYEYKYKQELELASFRELKLTKTVIATTKDLEKSRQNYLWAIIGVLLVSMLLGSIIFYQKFRNEKSKTQNIVIEQKLLRSQMTPHFIFNSLSVLQGMILNKEEEKSVSYLSKFSKLLRITLENSRDKTVSLCQEFTAVDNYLALQNLENERYKYTISIDDSIDRSLFKIPPMLIQPFVENTIEHAFVNLKENRIIDVHLSYSNKNLICTITDNGIGIEFQKENKNQHKKSLSTAITSERLKMLSKDFNMEGSVTIEDRKKDNEKGTVVTLVIPYQIHIA
ncbi:MAG: tetratricopeptide repeat protein [Cellulophaga sp.]